MPCCCCYRCCSYSVRAENKNRSHTRVERCVCVGGLCRTSVFALRGSRKNKFVEGGASRMLPASCGTAEYRLTVIRQRLARRSSWCLSSPCSTVYQIVFYDSFDSCRPVLASHPTTPSERDRSILPSFGTRRRIRCRTRILIDDRFEGTSTVRIGPVTTLGGPSLTAQPRV